MVCRGMYLQIWMQNVDHQRSYGTQYERMLAEYAEFLLAARIKLKRSHCVYFDGLDDLRQQLSLLSVKHLILHLLRICYIFIDVLYFNCFSF